MTDINDVYTQRAIAVCLFIKTMAAAGYRYGKGRDEKRGMMVVYVDSIQGQVSWHTAPRDEHIFHDFPPYPTAWDGTYLGCEPDFAKTFKP